MLRDLLKDRMPLEVVAGQVGKTKEAVRQKMISLGLKELEHRKMGCCSSDLKLPEELPSVEEALKVLSAALKALEQPGLSRAEVMRLRCIIQGVKVYKELLIDYVDYRGMEGELVEQRQALAEMRKAYETVVKKVQDTASKPVES